MNAPCLRRESRHRRQLQRENDDDEDSPSSASPSSTVPNLAYPPAFKMEVALYARSHSQYSASKIFAVARLGDKETSLRCWRSLSLSLLPQASHL